MPTLLLTLHLLGMPAGPAPQLHLLPGLQLLPSLHLVPHASLAALPLLGGLRLGATVETAPGTPPTVNRFLITTAEIGLGAGALLVNDVVVAGLDAMLFVSALVGASATTDNGFMFLGSVLGLLLLNGVDLVAVPFIAAGTAYGVSHLFHDTGGRFWLAVAGAVLAQTVILGGSFGVLFLKSAGFQNFSGPGGNGALPILLVAEVLHLVAIPLAASVGLHWKQASVPQRAEPTEVPATPSLNTQPTAAHPPP